MTEAESPRIKPTILLPPELLEVEGEQYLAKETQLSPLSLFTCTDPKGSDGHSVVFIQTTGSREKRKKT